MKTVVVKIGGSLAIDEAKLLDFTRSIARLSALGFRVAVVHGGGKDINENIALLRNGNSMVAALYISLSLFLGLLAVQAGSAIAKNL